MRSEFQDDTNIKIQRGSWTAQYGHKQWHSHSWHSDFEVDNKNNEVKKQLIQTACSLGFSNTDSYDIASYNFGKSTDISATFYQREPSHKTNPTAPFGKCFHRSIRTQNCARDCTVANLTAGVTSFTAICEINKGEHTAEQRTKADVSGSILPALKTLFRGRVHLLFRLIITCNYLLLLTFLQNGRTICGQQPYNLVHACRIRQQYVRGHFDVLRTVVGRLRQFSCIYSNILIFRYPLQRTW